jgi:cell division septal protein FtsQ
MATCAERLDRGKKGPWIARTRPFQRGGRDTPLQKSRRRRVLRLGHVLALFLLAAGLFAGLHEAYLFLITWDELTIRTVEVHCAKDGLRRALEDHFASPRLGNLLLCDIRELRSRIRQLAWVKDVRIQKVFPSALRIEIVERVPFALLERDGLGLADESGVVMERVDPAADGGLPVISDEGGFSSRFLEKWAQARDCLLSLPPAEKARLAGIRCSDFGRLELAFRDDPVRVTVAAGSAAAGLALFRGRRAEWERRLGPLAAANLGYEGRVYLRTAEPGAAGGGPNSPKEME